MQLKHRKMIKIFRKYIAEWGHAVAQLVETQNGRSLGRFPMVSLEFFIGLTMALGSTQPLTEMSTRNIS
jgi:hypothetical protein